MMSLSPKAAALSALYENCLFRSDTRVEAHQQVAQELADHVLRWKRGAPNVALHKGELNQLTLYALQYGAEVEVTPRPFDGFTLVHTSLVGAAEFECDGRTISVSEGRTAVLAPKQKARLRWLSETQHLIIKVPNELMYQVSGRSTDEYPVLTPGFLLPRTLSPQWDLLAHSLLNILSMSGDAGIRAEWRDHFEHTLAMFLFAHQLPALGVVADNARALPAELGTQNSGIRQMDAVIDYINSRLCAPISLEDLSRAAGVSFRTLNALCHRYCGVTPMELLRNTRLDAVRVRLLSDPAASITNTALAFGFGHLGRFSAYYFARFNELPRDTQRKREV